jgi:hypothetical protein
VSKMIFEPMARLAQTMHISCIDTNTVSKLTKTRFHRTHVAELFHRVCPNDFWAYGTFVANRAHILCQISTISKQNETSI